MSKYPKISKMFPKDIDHKETAEKIGVSLSAFRSYMYGTRRPTPENALKIQKYLDEKYGKKVALDSLLIKATA